MTPTSSAWATGWCTAATGSRLRSSSTTSVIDAIRAVSDLAPLHNPANLLGIEAVAAERPELPQVAVFDTAFHQTMPATAYPLRGARELVRRPRRAPVRLPRHQPSLREPGGRRPTGPPARRAPAGDRPPRQRRQRRGRPRRRVGRHDDGPHPAGGAGDGNPVGRRRSRRCSATSAIGPGSASTTSPRPSTRRAGCCALSGIGNDMRAIAAAAAGGDERARLAIDVFAYRVGQGRGRPGRAARSPRRPRVHRRHRRERRRRAPGGDRTARIPRARPSILRPTTTTGGRPAVGSRRMGLRSRSSIPTDEELLIARDTARLVRVGQNDAGVPHDSSPFPPVAASA